MSRFCVSCALILLASCHSQYVQLTTPVKELWTDPGELQGTWDAILGRYHFSKQGNEYFGVLEKILPPLQKITSTIEDRFPPPRAQLAMQGYRQGDVVYKVKRTGPQTYEGIYHNRCGLQSGECLRTDTQLAISLYVLGDFMVIFGPQKIDKERLDLSIDKDNIMMRLGSVLRMPDFTDCSYDQRRNVVLGSNFYGVWYLASKKTSKGETLFVLIHDSANPRLVRVQPVVPFLEYMKSNKGMKKKVKKAGYKIVTGPEGRPACVCRFLSEYSAIRDAFPADTPQ